MSPPDAAGDHICCRGIRTHNLKNINLDLPLGRWIAVTGVSGSGKSSLVFDTLFAESQRRFLETLGTYERQFLQGLPQGDFDSIDLIPPAIALKQSNRAGDPRSVLATVTDLAEPLRSLFSILMENACVSCGNPVTIQSVQDLHLHISSEFSSGKSLAVLSIFISIPNKERRESFIAGLKAEGYDRVLSLKGEVVDLDSLSEEQMEIEVVLDRVSADTDPEELQNRLSAVWSQVRFSPRVHDLRIRIDKGPPKIFVTNPYCSYCCNSTRVLQQSDLNWESALGHCPECQGAGNVARIDPLRVIPNSALSVAEGAIKPWTTQTFLWMKDALVEEMVAQGIDHKTPWAALPEATRSWIWSGKDSEGQRKSSLTNTVFIDEFFAYLEQERYKSSSRILLAKYRHYVTCSSCTGERLSPVGRSSRCGGVRFPELMAKEAKEVLEWLHTVKRSGEHASRLEKIPYLVDELQRKLELICDLGLGSCSLWRRSRTLSGGEFQRALLSRVVGNGLTNALYVLDEPSVGLGESEIPRLVEVIRRLRDQGNTVLMVDHDSTLISSADQCVELGPSGGKMGGWLQDCHGGIPQSSRSGRTPDHETKATRSPGEIELRGFSAIHCHDIDVKIPLSRLVVITGPSGAGKSTLLRFGLSAALEHATEQGIFSCHEADLDRGVGTWRQLGAVPGGWSHYTVVTLDQKPLQRSITSIVATVLGVMDTLRSQLGQTVEARRMGLTPSHFSFNSEGGCPGCEGRGFVADDLFFLGEVQKTCPECNGCRYLANSRKVSWEGRDVVEWLGLTIDETLASPLAQASGSSALRFASQLGLGYLNLGLATTSLSGGEAQRLRIAAALAKGKRKLICLLDEPSRGLSESDVTALLTTLWNLTRAGHTFIVVEHHPTFRRWAHHVIHMGPGSGKEGGKIVKLEQQLGE